MKCQSFLLLLFLFGLRLAFLPKIDLKDGQAVRVTGVLTSEPQVSGNRQQIKIGRFSVWAGRYPEYHYGDGLEVVGKVKSKPLTALKVPFVTLKSYQLVEASVSGTTGTKSITSIKGGAIRLGMRMKEVFNQIFPKPYDGIMAGIVLGDKSLISKDYWSEMQKTGTLHIMVASGMNIAFFVKGVLNFFTRFFKRRVAILCLICVIWIYSTMTGLAPPMIRAATLMSLIYLSQLTGRETGGGRVLVITGLIMLFANPLWLFDVGFQLSFLATAGLVWIEPKLGRSNNFTSSLAAQIATLPILAINFGSLNLLSPFINLLVLWAVPYILQFGMVIGLLGVVWIPLAKISSYLVFPLIFYLKQTIDLFAKITLVQVSLPKLGWWLVIGYYLIVWLWIKNFKY